MRDKLIFLGLLAAAMVLSQIPVIHWPFSWLETFCHELSHGLAALLTGGRIVKIVLHLDGSGFCYTSGGNRFLVAFSGYFGAVLWGGIIYLGALSSGAGTTRVVAGTLLSVLLLSTVLWVRDPITLVLMAVLMGLFALQLRFTQGWLLNGLLRLSGLYVALDAVRSPLALLDGRHLGDGATLSDLTLIPELVWVGIWELLALGALWYLWRITARWSSDQPQEPARAAPATGF